MTQGIPDADDSPEGEDDFPGDEAPPAAGAGLQGEWVAGPAHSGERLDKALAQLVPEVSRARLRRWIDEGRVLVGGKPRAANAAVAAGERILVDVPAQAAPEGAPRAEPMDLAIVHQDADLIVLDKPAGLVVHPGAGNAHGTLMNGLLAHDPALAALPRAGIVHRLDAGTTGLMVVARNERAQLSLSRQLLDRTVTREYWALVLGACLEGGIVHGTIDAAIERDPRNRLRFRVGRSALARPARTHWKRLALLEAQRPAVSWISCRLDTGRTHQIRVHLEHLGHPLLGDPVYRRGLPAGTAALPPLARQALHACRLALVHPTSGEECAWFQPPPADLRAAMRALGIDARRLDRP